MAEKIAFDSFKGGTGVTTCCLNIGLALAKSGERTLVVDGDRNCGGALISCGMQNMQVYTLGDYEAGACRAKQAMVRHPKCQNLCVMPSLGLNNLAYAEKAIAEVEGLFDYILADKIAVSVCDRAVIVCEPYAPSIKSADCCRSRLFDNGLKDVGIIVNRINGGLVINREILTAQEIATLLHLPLKAVIPEDLNISLGKMNADTQKSFNCAADMLKGKRENIYNVLHGYRGAGGYFKRKMRERI